MPSTPRSKRVRSVSRHPGPATAAVKSEGNSAENPRESAKARLRGTRQEHPSSSAPGAAVEGPPGMAAAAAPGNMLDMTSGTGDYHGVVDGTSDAALQLSPTRRRRSERMRGGPVKDAASLPVSAGSLVAASVPPSSRATSPDLTIAESGAAAEGAVGPSEPFGSCATAADAAAAAGWRSVNHGGAHGFDRETAQNAPDPTEATAEKSQEASGTGIHNARLQGPRTDVTPSDAEFEGTYEATQLVDEDDCEHERQVERALWEFDALGSMHDMDHFEIAPNDDAPAASIRAGALGTDSGEVAFLSSSLPDEMGMAPMRDDRGGSRGLTRQSRGTGASHRAPSAPRESEQTAQRSEQGGTAPADAVDLSEAPNEEAESDELIVLDSPGDATASSRRSSRPWRGSQVPAPQRRSGAPPSNGGSFEWGRGKRQRLGASDHPSAGASSHGRLRPGGEGPTLADVAGGNDQLGPGVPATGADDDDCQVLWVTPTQFKRKRPMASAASRRPAAGMANQGSSSQGRQPQIVLIVDNSPSPGAHATSASRQDRPSFSRGSLFSPSPIPGGGRDGVRQSAEEVPIWRGEPDLGLGGDGGIGGARRVNLPSEQQQHSGLLRLEPFLAAARGFFAGQTSSHAGHAGPAIGTSYFHSARVGFANPALPAGGRVPAPVFGAKGDDGVGSDGGNGSGPASDAGRSPADGASTKIKCPICLDNMSEPTSTTCGHLFCFLCISQAVKAKKSCPSCRRKLSSKGYHRVYFGA